MWLKFLTSQHYKCRQKSLYIRLTVTLIFESWKRNLEAATYEILFHSIDPALLATPRHPSCPHLGHVASLCFEDRACPG